MPTLMQPPPHTPVEPVTEILHGVPVTDPYRWLEDQNSLRTRTWIAAQTQFARSYLDAIPGRDRIRERVRELADVETYDSLQKVGNRYFFRKRLPGREQPSIYRRGGIDGADQLLIDPADRGTGTHTAVKLLEVSHDGSLLLYEIKEGGERSGKFEFLETQTRRILRDRLPSGYLRGFAFAPDARSFYYSHELERSHETFCRAVYQHRFGTSFEDDKEIFSARHDGPIRLTIVPGKCQIGFLVFRFCERTLTDFYILPFVGSETAKPVLRNMDYLFGPALLGDGRILALIDRDCPNRRIVEVRIREGHEPDFVDIIPACDTAIQNWIVTGERIVVSYLRNLKTQIHTYNLLGTRLRRLPTENCETLRVAGASDTGDELFVEQESFAKPVETYIYSTKQSRRRLWAARRVPFSSGDIVHRQVWFTANDGARIPMYLVGHRSTLEGGPHPAVMTAYGGYGIPMTPRFSILVALLIEHGCLFALPNIRGGSEFGVTWHTAAKRRNRQVAFDDFVCAAEWLVETGHTEPTMLAAFGGSNSGLLVGAAMTQRPDLFRAVVCLAPLLDMLRYHRFDNAHSWKEEFGTADDPEDFPVLASYSPYHRVREGVRYPAALIVSGDRDQNCNPLHARKMTARLQAANVSDHPILLDYSPYRGHSPVLPLSDRVEALADRVAFLCDQLHLPL